ncbi:MAG TPA: trypsin-like peptidase domain-containing protein [Planctomycetota bacterium]|nr:trypsin-like peptidase domain-containing protein [Planctomycetota bacterium]
MTNSPRLLTLLFVYGAGLLTSLFIQTGRPVIQKVDPSVFEKLDDPSRSYVAATKAAEPAVVHLIVSRVLPYEDPFGDFFRAFGRRRGVVQQTSMGSGVIVDARGIILTNAHVVRQASDILAILPDGRRFQGATLKIQEDLDLAIVKIPGSDLPVARLGDSDGLEVGQIVIAIGNPFGLEHTVTAGVVSALRQKGTGISDSEDYIQTDAAINPGNSGGPLIDLKGRVIGINSAILSHTGGYQGVGFAIPINLARSIMKEVSVE